MIKNNKKGNICHWNDDTSEISSEDTIYPPIFYFNTWTKSVPICVIIILLSSTIFEHNSDLNDTYIYTLA